MSRYLSHLAALTLNRVEPVQPRLASRFETPVNRGSSDHNGLDVAQESRISAPPAHVQPATVTVTDSPDRVKLMPQRLASRLEMPADRGSSDNNGLNVAQEFRISAPPAHVQPATVTVTDSPDRVKLMPQRLASRLEMPADRGSSDNNGLDVAQEFRISAPPAHVQPATVTVTDSPDRAKLMPQRLASRFEMPTDRNTSGNNGLDVALESRVVPPAHLQSSTVTATDSPVAQRVVTASTDGQAKKESSGLGQPKVVEPTEFMIKKSELSGNQQKISSGQSVTSFDTMVNTEQTNRAAQSINKLVAQAPYKVRKDTLPTENVRTLVERVQERFTETTHSELVIREVAAPDANKKNSKPEESPHAAPVKPASIVVRSEQSTGGPNTASQAGTQSVSSAQFGTDPTPTPTIQVTIGRIEIRATQVADKPIARPRAASTTMSLDDYLKQRESKERT